MKSYKILFLLAGLTLSCNSIKKHNATLNDNIAVEDIHKDIDYTYKQLQKWQPSLYEFISKEKLDAEFQSLKKSINKPLTSFEFYTKLAPVVGKIGQGHTFVYPNSKRFTKKELENYKKSKHPFNGLEFEAFDNKIYISQNRLKDSTLQPFDEIIALANENMDSFLKESENWFSSDGYNTTFKKRTQGRKIDRFFQFKHHLLDSIPVTFVRNSDTLSTVLYREKKEKKETKKWKEYSKTEKDSIIKEGQRKFKFGFDKDTDTFKRAFNFIDQDSCVAVMDINGFTNGNYSSFYKEAFTTLKNNDSDNLIIDLRANGGGRLSEIANLYGYLSPTEKYTFLEKSLVTKKLSLFKSDYFKDSSIAGYAVKGILSPIYYGFMYFKVHKNKEDGKYYYNSQTKEKERNELAFNGNVYVLIDGGSFSASSIISTKLQANNRATFVGEETGGAYNGTVAGQMPIITLPNSKNKVRIGLIRIGALEKTDTIGRGVFPDVEIIPTVEEFKNKQDKAMEWILNDIENKANTSAE